jgi:predicted Zn-dependent peptidase
MKRIIYLLLATLFVVTSCNKYSYESVPGDPLEARIYTLDNGLKVYMVVNKDEPRVNAHVAIRVGSKNDPVETTGLAHYFEHLMFKGTEKFGTQNYEEEKVLLDRIEELFEIYRVTTDEEERTAIYKEIDSISYEASKIAIPNEYDKLMASIGARGTNAYTGNDVTCYVENIPSNQIDNWARIQADRFANCVIRGFHTELETIYEEYNMYAAMDSEKQFEALFAELFKKHTYGTPVIGWANHLKNPSITNVKNYKAEWYVPNNMAVCLAGDFDPDKAIKIIDKHFSALKPNPDLPKLEFEPEDPITEPRKLEVLGVESPSTVIAWRFPGAASPEALMLDLLRSVLYNGSAGLIDLNVNQQQKTLEMGAGNYSLADYSAFIIMGEPKKGQTLDEVAAIAFEELEKIKSGNFDDDLLLSIINNMKRQKMQQNQNASYIVRSLVNCFIDGIPWADYISEVDRLSKITKEELVAFVNEHFADNYIRVDKIEKKDPTDTRIAKPAITPIFTNRDTSSAFLREIQASQVKPIEPVFVDFEKDMDIFTAKSDIQVLYKQNTINDLFTLTYLFETGSYADKVLPIAADYLSYLGTSKMSKEEFQKALYKIACSVNIVCTGERTHVTISGLGENMEEAVKMMEELIADAQPDEEVLALLKGNMLQARANAKLGQRDIFSRLQMFAVYGLENPYTNVLSDYEIRDLKGSDLTDMIHNIFSKEHKVLYYGPAAGEEIVNLIAETHNVPETLSPVVSGNPFQTRKTEGTKVFLAPFDANQLFYIAVSNAGQKYDPALAPIVHLYNSYFGSGMNSIVFQEMREARGLAYSASAGYNLPEDLEHEGFFNSFIATQNDKLIDAMTSFDEIINNMPVSQNAFDIAQESIITNLRTARTVRDNVFWKYLAAQNIGLDYDINRDIFEKVQTLTLDDVVKFQQDNIKDRDYAICILGRYEDFDMKSLLEYGPIQKLELKEIFGY